MFITYFIRPISGMEWAHDQLYHGRVGEFVRFKCSRSNSLDIQYFIY